MIAYGVSGCEQADNLSKQDDEAAVMVSARPYLLRILSMQPAEADTTFFARAFGSEAAAASDFLRMAPI